MPKNTRRKASSYIEDFYPIRTGLPLICKNKPVDKTTAWCAVLTKGLLWCAGETFQSSAFRSMSGVTFWYGPIFQYTWGTYTNGIPIYVYLGLHRTSFSMYCATQGVSRIRASVYMWWGSGILCKPECYTGTSDVINASVSTFEVS